MAATSSGRLEKNLLMVVIDVSDTYQSTRETPSQKLTLQQCIDHVIVYINSYLLSSQCNTVGVVLCHQIGSTIVYPGHKELANDETNSTGKYEPLEIMNNVMKSGIEQFMNTLSESPPSYVSSSTLLSSALSTSLCYIQRFVRESQTGVTVNPRILVIRGDSDTAVQHVSIMNCIFAAQKQNIPIDCCVLWDDSTYLQQAADITGGIYIKVPEPAGLIQYLMWVFLPDVKSRSILHLPHCSSVDYRAACFCHQRLVDMGFVCSVCLAVLCNFIPICPVCQTHFKLPSLPLLKSKKKGKGKSKSKPQ